MGRAEVYIDLSEERLVQSSTKRQPGNSKHSHQNKDEAFCGPCSVILRPGCSVSTKGAVCKSQTCEDCRADCSRCDMCPLCTLCFGSTTGPCAQCGYCGDNKASGIEKCKKNCEKGKKRYYV